MPLELIAFAPSSPSLHSSMSNTACQSAPADAKQRQTPDSARSVSIDLDRALQMSFAQPAAATRPPICLLLLLPLLPIIPVLLIIQLATAGSSEEGISKFLVGFELGLLAVGGIAFMAIRRRRRTDAELAELHGADQESIRSLTSLRRGNEAVRMQLAARMDS